MTHPIARWFNAAALVLAPTTGLIAAVAVPGLSTTARGRLHQVAAHPERYHVYALGILVSSYLLVPAFFGLMELVRERSPRSASLAGGLAQIGAIIAIGDAAVESMYWTMGSTADLGPMTTLSDRYDAGTGWVYAIGGLAVLIGTVGLGVSLWRTRVVPRWVGVGVGLSVVLNVVGFSVASQPALVGSYVVMLAAFGRAALALVDRDQPTRLPSSPTPAGAMR